MKALERFLLEEKDRRGNQCELCKRPRPALVWRYKLGADKPFPVSRGPRVRGMTRGKLEVLLGTVTLTCRPCWRQLLEPGQGTTGIRDLTEYLEVGLVEELQCSLPWGVKVGNLTFRLSAS